MTSGNAFFTDAERALHAEVEGFCPPDEEPRLNDPVETHNEAWADKMQAKREARMLAALAARARGEENGR